MTTTVYIAINEPFDERDPNHWAIFLHDSVKGDVILQVGDDKGGVGYFVEEPLYHKQPQRSGRHETSIEVGTIKCRWYYSGHAGGQQQHDLELSSMGDGGSGSAGASRTVYLEHKREGKSAEEKTALAVAELAISFRVPMQARRVPRKGEWRMNSPLGNSCVHPSRTFASLNLTDGS